MARTPEQGENLLTTKDIAKMLGVTRQHATARIVRRADFPPPVVNVSRRMRLWSIESFNAWASGQPKEPTKPNGTEQHN